MSNLPSHLFVSDCGNMFDCRKQEWHKKPLRKNYACFDRELSGGSIAIRAAIRARYTLLGGYELYFITSDGAAICCDCAQKEYRQIAYSVRHKINDGWRVVGVECTANTDNFLSCDHCGRVLVEDFEDCDNE